MNLSRILSIILLVSATTQSTDLLSMKRSHPDKSTPPRRSARRAKANATTLAQSVANRLKAAQRGPTKRRKTNELDETSSSTDFIPPAPDTATPIVGANTTTSSSHQPAQQPAAEIELDEGLGFSLDDIKEAKHSATNSIDDFFSHSSTTTPAKATPSSSSSTTNTQQQQAQQTTYDQQAYARALSGVKDLRWVNLQGAKFIGTAEHPIDLSGVDFTGADLTEATFVHVNLSGANLTNATLHNAKLDNCNLTRSIIMGTIFTGTDPRSIKKSLTPYVTAADLTTCLTDTDLTNAVITNAIFTYAIFDGVTIGNSVLDNGPILDHVDFSQTKFNQVQIRNITIQNNTTFAYAELKAVQFDHVTITNVSCFKAIFSAVIFLKSRLQNINMKRLNAFMLFFRETSLSFIDFANADLVGFGIDGLPIIGPNLNFEYTRLSQGYIVGEIIRLFDQQGKQRTQGITENNDPEAPLTFWGGATYVACLGGGLIVTAFTTVLCPPAGVGAGTSTVALSVSAADEVDKRIRENNQIFVQSNINSIINESNFNGTILSKFYASNLKFGNCTGLNNIGQAQGCVFYNIVSSNPNDLVYIKNHGALVNGAYSDGWSSLWTDPTEREKESKGFVTNLLAIAGSAFLGEGCRAIAQIGIDLFKQNPTEHVKETEANRAVREALLNATQH